MRKAALMIITAGTLGTATAADAGSLGRPCTSAPQSQWLSMQDLQGLTIGFVAAFISAFLCVRWLIRYVSRHDFVPFAWYRIAFGLLIVLTAWSGIVQWD